LSLSVVEEVSVEIGRICRILAFNIRCSFTSRGLKP